VLYNADFSTTGGIVIGSPILEAKVAELDYDPKKILEWVKFNIHNEFPYGSMKDAEKVFTDLAGNPFGQAKLLATMLRIAGIETRYLEGNLTMDIGTLMSWTGGETPESAISIIKDNGTPISVIYKFGAPQKVTIEHIWVSALIDHKKWVPMDPSIKAYENIEGLDNFKVNKEDAEAAIGSMTAGSTDNVLSLNFDGIDALLDSITAEIEGEYGHLTMAEFTGGRKIVVESKKKIGHYLSKKISGYKKATLEYAEIPESRKAKIKMRFLDYYGNPYGEEYEDFLSEVAEKKITLKHIPATQADEDIIKNSDGGTIYDVYPAYNVNMRPSLQVGGETKLIGNSKKLGSTSQWIRTSVLMPATGYWEHTYKPIESGSTYVIAAAQQKQSPEEIKALCDQLEIDAEAVDPDIDKLREDMLHIGGKLYNLLVNKFMDPVTKELKIVNTKHVPIAYVCNELEPTEYGYYGYANVNRGGAHIDVLRTANCPISITGDEKKEFIWMQESSKIGSSMEGTMLELMYPETDAVSTARIIHESALQGVKIHIIDNPATLEDQLKLVEADEVVKNNIRGYINNPFADYVVLIPEKETDTKGIWKGQGWEIMNKATGESSMLIYGALQTENTTSSTVLGGAMLVYPSEDYEAELVVKALKAAKTAWAAGDTLVVAYSMAIVGGAKMVAATKVMAAAKTTAPIIAATPFVIIGQAIGMAFIAAAAVTFVYLVVNYVMAFIVPRREYCYV
ncbi:MAG: transglutaminase domain-containing protein, partial [Nanoarchaeota archaeon]|nr:transglutaminase domain-containing protein [Nanoarchaeota archaeon]